MRARRCEAQLSRRPKPESERCWRSRRARAFAAPSLEGVKLPPGFQIEVWADNVPTGAPDGVRPEGHACSSAPCVRRQAGGARSTPSARSTASASSRRCSPASTIPNGVAVRNGDSLRRRSESRSVRYDNIEANLDKPPKPVVVTQLPTEQHHGWRYIAFGPDDKLYVAIGAPCNVCDKGDEGYAQILRMNPDGSGRELVAQGRAQLRGLHVAAEVEQALVHRQRPRRDGRQRAGLRAEPARQGRRRLRLPVLPRRSMWWIRSSASSAAAATCTRRR